MCGIALRLWLARPGSVETGSLPLPAGSISREEVIAIAQSYVEHRWQGSNANIKHGPDSQGVEVQTPESVEKAGEKIGIPYKWGGFDTPESFDQGIREQKAAGDIYSSDKRKKGDSAVSSDAVGIDCSGFVSRCWKLPDKYGTASLPGLCEALGSCDELKPGDIMDQPRGHVLLFAKWLDDSKSSALFYDADGGAQARVVAGVHRLALLRLMGAKPFRYKRIRDK
ncbi:MAG: hypothetical protein JWL90_1469 [Chthoniobacteraceae bacterium]|nr:hypothetical protein [Chthoniobacteraceae bacterium]